MKYCIILIFSFLITTCERFKQDPNSFETNADSYRIVSYNVENLFDTWDEVNKFDEDFTPSGSYYWGQERYEKKLKAIGKVLANTSANNVPAIIGLIEVENKRVLEDLLNQSPLTKFQYAIVHEDSPDERGIDVALLYDTNQFEYLDYEIGRIQFPDAVDDATRDILIVKGKLAGEVVYCIVNHWPSRRGGASASEPKRLYVADFLKEKVDLILAKEPEAGIIIMGDFNDTPSNRSLNEKLNAGSWADENDLINLMLDAEKSGKGTYKFQNQWNMLDQFIISKNLIDHNGKLLITKKSAQIFDANWLQENDPNYPGKRIYRTYLGPNYIGGYSDHFPIVLDVFLQ